MNGTGMLGAMQGITSGYDFGLKLAGQDDATLDRALKERQGLMAFADAANQARERNALVERDMRLRDALERAKMGQQDNQFGQTFNEGQRQFDNRMIFQRSEQDRIKDQFGKEFGFRQAVSDRDYIEGTRRYDQDFGFRKTNADREYGLDQRRVGAYEGTANAQIRGTNASAAEQEEETRQRKVSEEEARNFQRFVAGDPDLDPAVRDRFEKTLKMSHDPAAIKAMQMVKEAAPKGAAGFTPEVQGAVLNSLRIPLQAGIGAVDSMGNTVVSIDPVAMDVSPDGGYVRIKVQKKSKDGALLKPEERFVTNGRIAESDGGVPRVFKPDDLINVIQGMSGLQDLKGPYEEAASSYRSDLERKRGRSNEEVAKDDLQREISGAKTIADEAKRREALEKALTTSRRTTFNHASSVLDARAGIDKDSPTAATRTPEATKAVMQARQTVLDTITSELKAAPVEAFEGEFMPEDVFRLPKVRQAMETYQRLYNGESAQPAAPTTGPFQNMRSNPGFGSPGASGGTPGPFPSGAPSGAQGNYHPTAYRPAQPVAMPQNLSVVGTARNFGIDRVDPSLVEGVKAMAQLWPGRVEIFSSGRGDGDKGNHSDWKALDIRLITPDGKVVPEHQSHQAKWHGGGSSGAHLYERFWQGAFAWAAQNDPTVLERARWGGDFGEGDYMHGDLQRGTRSRKGVLKGPGALGDLVHGRSTQRHGGQSYGIPGGDWNAFGQQLFGNQWRGIPMRQRTA